MTLSPFVRPVLVSVAALAVSGCGFVESDPNRFENLARRVAEVPVELERPRAQPAPAVSAMGLRPATYRQPVKVEVLDPHALWAARDGMIQSAVGAATPQLAKAAPAMAQAVVEQAVDAAPKLRPAIRGEAVKLIQLGAFSDRASAQEAWRRLAVGELSGLDPVYEAVAVNGRTLTRLKVAAPTSAAVGLCRAAGVSDPWCAGRA